MKLHEEFKEYENLWDTSLKEAPELDAISKVLNKLPKIELWYDGFDTVLDQTEDHFDPTLEYGHYQTGGEVTVNYPSFRYYVDVDSVYETLRDSIIPAYKNEIPADDLLKQYLTLEQACEKSTIETEDEAYEALELFLANNLEYFVDLFEKQLLDYYSESAKEWAVDHIEPDWD